MFHVIGVLFADQAELAYIAALDAEKDLHVLAQNGLGIRPECARVLRVLTALLKLAASRGLTPFHIGSIMCRCHSLSLIVNEDICRRVSWHIAWLACPGQPILNRACP